MGIPGSLPLLNKSAVEKATLIAMALDCKTPDKIANGLPIGMQIMANSLKENSLLQAAYALEKTVELPEVPI